MTRILLNHHLMNTHLPFFAFLDPFMTLRNICNAYHQLTSQITGRQKGRLVCVKWSEAEYTK